MKSLLLLPVLFGSILLAGCASPRSGPVGPGSTATPQRAATLTGETLTQESTPSALDLLVPTLADLAPTRTPVPTGTPDVLAASASDLIQKTRLSGQELMGLEYDRWINLGISLLLVLAGYLLGTGLLRWVFPWLVRRTKTVLDDRLLQVSGGQLRWLIVVLTLKYATNRLDMIPAESKTVLNDLYFFLILFLVVVVLWRLTDLVAGQVKDQSNNAGSREGLSSLIRLSVWFLRFLLIIFAVSISLAHFAINITGVAIFLVVIGVVLSLAGRDVLADMMAGVIILIDRPYRVGDRIDLTSLNSWGDVVDIGMRSTRILTWENRLVIIPNSQMGKNQIVNYSLPDASCYDMVGFVTAYENDVEQIRQSIASAVGLVEGVQKGRPVNVQLRELSEYSMLFKVGWWIGSYHDIYPVRDMVNRVVLQTLAETGAMLPFERGSLKVAVNADDKKP